MSDSPAEQHPLDLDDDSNFGQPDSAGITPVHGPLQKFAIFTLLGSGVLVVMSGVIAANAPANSPLEDISSGLNRLFATLLLLGFVALLVSYQIPRIKERMAERRIRPGDQPHAPGITSQTFRTLRLLGAFSGTAILASWLSLLLPPFLIPGVLLLQVLMLYVAFGLSITVAVWHTEEIRAFAIGTGAAIFLSPFLLGFLLFWGQWPGRGTIPLLGISAALITMILISGLTSAAYVGLLNLFRPRNDAAPKG
jgi:hypothetical protein